MKERRIDRSASTGTEPTRPREDEDASPVTGMDAVIDDVEDRATAMIGRLKEKLPHQGGKGET
jgi:hypothetical protein